MKGWVESQTFGQLSDQSEARAYRLCLENGVSAQVTDFGASLIGFCAPDRDGRIEDVVLACHDAAGLEGEKGYLGAAIGRVAGRIGNAQFLLDGTQHTLSRNAVPHHVHGGFKGLGRALWQGQIIDNAAVAVRFSIESKHGDQGYPGNLIASLTYRIEAPAKLTLTFEAEADQATPFNPTCHAYFNLDGHTAASIKRHSLKIPASFHTPTGSDLIPTGEIAPIADTPFDFLEEKPIAQDWAELPNGYDHNFVLDEKPGQLRKAAELYSARSGRKLTVGTDRPCIHLYTGGGLNVPNGKGGASYAPMSGLALETQGFPDAVNHSTFQPDILRPGETFFSQTTFEIHQDNIP